MSRATYDDLAACRVVDLTEPGTAEVVQHRDGTRTVRHADPVIRVSVELLRSEGLAADAIEPGGVLRLDTAGRYRYRFVRAESEHVHLYECIGNALTCENVMQGSDLRVFPHGVGPDTPSLVSSLPPEES